MEDSTGSVREKPGFFERFFKKNDEDSVEKEILSMVNEGHESGALETSEATMINNIFEFVDKEASDICTKRNDIDSIDKNTYITDALNHVLNSSYSRYPVYDETIDNVIGILYLKDLCRIKRTFR